MQYILEKLITLMANQNLIQVVHAKLINFGQIRLISWWLGHKIVGTSYAILEDFTGGF